MNRRSVHRYDSLSLLNQVVFAKGPPKKSAREGILRRSFAKSSGRNLADRDGALEYIKRPESGGAVVAMDARVAGEDEALKLQEIERDMTLGDGDVMFALGRFLRGHDRQQDRATLVVQPSDNRRLCDEPEMLTLKRWLVFALTTGILNDGATEDALHVLQADGLPPPLVREEAIGLVARERAAEVAESHSVAVSSLDVDGRVWLAKVLNGSLNEVGIGVSPFWRPLIVDERSASG